MGRFGNAEEIIRRMAEARKRIDGEAGWQANELVRCGYCGAVGVLAKTGTCCAPAARERMRNPTVRR